MKNFKRHATILGLAIMALPVALHAQRGVGPRQGGAVGNPVAPLINMRRALNLTSRQLTQLDSIERALLQRNRAVQERMRAGMDSLRPRGQLTDEQRTAVRSRADSLRTLRQQIGRNDSTARAAVMRILTDSQRTQVRVRQAAQRGFAQGRAAAMRGQRGMRQGGRAGQQGIRGRMQAQPRGRMGARGAMGPRMGPPAGGMGVGPRFQGRRPPGQGGQVGPMNGQPGPMGGGMRRMGPPNGVGPVDDMDMMATRRRGMMGGGATPPEPPVPPVRRPPADSGR